MYRKAVSHMVELAPAIAGAARARALLAACRSRFGQLLHSFGRDEEALAAYSLAHADQESLAAAPDATPESRRDLAVTINGNAALLAAMGKSADAEAEFRKSLALRQKLADDNPAVPEFQKELATCLLDNGWRLAPGKTAEAIGYYAREEAIRMKLAQANSATPDDRDLLANCQTNRADVLRLSGQLELAVATCKRTLTTRESLIAAHPDRPAFRTGLGETYLRLGQVRYDLGDLTGAATDWKAACTSTT